MYFYCNSTPRIVTDADIYRPGMRERIDSWAKLVEERCSNKLIPLSTDVEVLLQLDDSKPDHCGYYIIDHGTRTQFWIDNPDPNSPNPIGNSGEFRAAEWCNCSTNLFLTESTVEEQYWNHVECFPMHLSGLTSDILDELVDAFCDGI